MFKTVLTIVLSLLNKLKIMKNNKISNILLFSLIFLSFNAKSGLKYSTKYYKKTEINSIIEDMTDPGFSKQYGEFLQLRTELYQQAAIQSERLSPREVEALELYQDYAYAMTREGLTSGFIDKQTQEVIDGLDSAFESSTKYQGVTYRGDSFIDAYISDIKVGDIVSPSSYVSTSISKTAAYVFHKGQLSRFELTSGKHGIVIPTVRDNELEVLIHRNSLFEVTAINTTAEGNIVIYREIPSNLLGNRKIKDIHTGDYLTATEACAF
ncbi:ADP-ribosyltransferase [Aliivibrio salmonicida]|uniref:ADP-ribosyltransferase n=1 Tax=Aliivibrio salmonicida TaxID=40269 RepID=UPI003D0A316D